MIIYTIPFYFVMFLLGTPSVPNNELQFDILFKDEVVGNLQTSESVSDSVFSYKSSTSLEIRIIKDFKVDYMFDVTLKNGLLQQSDVDITVNQKPHAQTTTKLTHGIYIIEKDHEKETTVQDSITYTTVMLYFVEPVHIKRCYSEQDGTFNQLIPMGNHRYKKVNAKGRENIYQYANGKLEKASIDGGIVNFDIVAKD